MMAEEKVKEKEKEKGETPDQKSSEENSETKKRPEETEKEPDSKQPDEKEEKEDEKKKEDAGDKEEDADARYVRLMADFQNYKRRTEKEKADVYAYANEKIVTQLLQVLDNFERALQSECEDKKYAEGMSMIFKQLTDVLDKSGLEEIEALGQDFDPNFHHAVLTDSSDDFGSGQVTEVLQKGYKFNNKVIRPAMVKVNE